MLIIIEGVDGSGKSTLARQLADRHGFHVAHHGPPKAHPLHEYVAGVEALLREHERVVVDRLHIGELIWPHVFKRASLYHPWVHRYVEMYLHSRGALLVFCDDETAVLRTRLIARDGEAPPADDLVRWRAAFARVIDQRTTLPVVRHRGSDAPADPDHLVDVAAVLAAETRPVLDDLTREVVGPLAARVMLVGDQSGWAGGTPFPPFPGTSGEWLMRAVNALSQAAWSHQAVAITNAAPRGAAARLADLREALGGPSVVAMGNVAAKVLREARIPHGRVPHPQFVRRFYASDNLGYAAALADAARGEDRRGDFPPHQRGERA